MKLVFILALLVLFKTVILYRVYHLFPLTELRRRARAHEAGSNEIYKVASNSAALDVLLYIFGLAAASFLVISAARYSWWAAVAMVVFIAWLVSLAPRPKYGGFFWRLSVKSAPLVFKLLSWLRPGLELLARFAPSMPEPHSGAYEKDDLINLLKKQAAMSGNRIEELDLKIAANALAFGDKSVAKLMTPRKKLRFVEEDDVVGPLLIDELHKTGQQYFPVAKGSAKVNSPQVTGTLFLSDIIEVSQENKGKVKDVMKKGAFAIKETESLSLALEEILKNHHHQLLVKDNFEELVGVISLDAILSQLVAHKVDKPKVEEPAKADEPELPPAKEAEGEAVAITSQ